MQKPAGVRWELCNSLAILSHFLMNSCLLPSYKITKQFTSHFWNISKLSSTKLKMFWISKWGWDFSSLSGGAEWLAPTVMRRDWTATEPGQLCLGHHNWDLSVCHRLRWGSSRRLVLWMLAMNTEKSESSWAGLLWVPDCSLFNFKSITAVSSSAWEASVGWIHNWAS